MRREAEDITKKIEERVERKALRDRVYTRMHIASSPTANLMSEANERVTTRREAEEMTKKV